VLLGLQAGNVTGTHWLFLSLVLAAIEDECSIHSHAGYEDGAVVVNEVVDVVRGVDLDGDVSRVATAAQELFDSGLLILENARPRRISLGGLLADALAKRAGS
jgi:hypothetical protein